jgi:nucleoid-associated protein YgaU
MKPPAIACPYCKVNLPAGATACPDCGEDLSALMRLKLAPYVLYNEGLQRAQSGDVDGAIARMRQVVEALPHEPEPYAVLAKLCALKGDWAAAQRWWQQMAERWPDDDAARQGLAAVRDHEAALQGAQQAAQQGRQEDEQALRQARDRELAAARQAALEQERSSQQHLRRRAMVLAALAGGAIIALLAFGYIILNRPVPPPAVVVVITATPGEQAISAIAATATALPQPTATAVAVAATATPEATLASTPTSAPTPKPPAPPPPTPTATPLPDLVGAVRSAIHDDPVLASLTITVQQTGTSVWLEGEVPSVADKYRLEALAKSVPGVNLVDVSGLKVLYAVKRGDNLTLISRDNYGRAAYWLLIARANKLRNPSLIHVGQFLLLPAPR